MKDNFFTHDFDALRRVKGRARRNMIAENLRSNPVLRGAILSGVGYWLTLPLLMGRRDLISHTSDSNWGIFPKSLKLAELIRSLERQIATTKGPSNTLQDDLAKRKTEFLDLDTDSFSSGGLAGSKYSILIRGRNGFSPIHGGIISEYDIASSSEEATISLGSGRLTSFFFDSPSNDLSEIFRSEPTSDEKGGPATGCRIGVNIDALRFISGLDLTAGIAFEKVDLLTDIIGVDASGVLCSATFNSAVGLLANCLFDDQSDSSRFTEDDENSCYDWLVNAIVYGGNLSGALSPFALLSNAVAESGDTGKSQRSDKDFSAFHFWPRSTGAPLKEGGFASGVIHFKPSTLEGLRRSSSSASMSSTSLSAFRSPGCDILKKIPSIKQGFQCPAVLGVCLGYDHIRTFVNISGRQDTLTGAFCLSRTAVYWPAKVSFVIPVSVADQQGIIRSCNPVLSGVKPFIGSGFVNITQLPLPPTAQMTVDRNSAGNDGCLRRLCSTIGLKVALSCRSKGSFSSVSKVADWRILTSYRSRLGFLGEPAGGYDFVFDTRANGTPTDARLALAVGASRIDPSLFTTVLTTITSKKQVRRSGGDSLAIAMLFENGQYTTMTSQLIAPPVELDVFASNRSNGVVVDASSSIGSLKFGTD